MTVMTEEWVSLWYQCLSANMDYAFYCTARTENNEEESKEYEDKFEHIANIYRDFGELDQWPETGIDSDDWREWFEPRRHLFMSEVKSVMSASDYQQAQGHILLDISISHDRAKTDECISKFLDAYYDKQVINSAPEPIYALHLNGKGKVACGLKRVKNACIVQAQCYFIPKDDNYPDWNLTYRDTLAEFLTDKLEQLDWVFDTKAKTNTEAITQFKATGKLTDAHFEKFKRQVNRSRVDFKAFAGNVLHNRFPDDTFSCDANVLDNFDVSS